MTDLDVISDRVDRGDQEALLEMAEWYDRDGQPDMAEAARWMWREDRKPRKFNIGYRMFDWYGERMAFSLEKSRAIKRASISNELLESIKSIDLSQMPKSMMADFNSEREAREMLMKAWIKTELQKQEKTNVGREAESAWRLSVSDSRGGV